MTAYRTTIVYALEATTDQTTTIVEHLGGAATATVAPGAGTSIDHTVEAPGIQTAIDTAAYKAGAALAAAGLGTPGGPVAVTVAELDWHTAQTVQPGMPGTVQITDIAEILGVSHQRASQLAADDRFPDPLNPGGRTRVYDEAAVRAYAAKRRRGPGRPRKTA